MDFSAIKTLITQNIRTNNNEDITGSVLQQVLLGIIETLGDDAINDLVTAIDAEGVQIQNIRQTLQNLQNGGYLYGGVAVPGTSPGTPLVSTFFIATQAGTYNYFIDQNNNPITIGYDALYILTYEALENHYWEYQKVCDMGDGVYDISANHNGATYTDLAAALGTNGANVPEGIRKGGMRIQFVRSSDNKYVQYRLMSQNFTTDTANWRNADDDIDDINEHLYKIVPQSLYYLTWTKGQYTDTGNPNGTTTYATKESELLFVKKGESLSINDENYEFQVCFYDNTPSHVFIRRDEKKSSYTFTEDSVIHVTIFRKNSTTAITDYIATGAKLIYSERRTEASTCLNVFGQQNLREECKQYGLDNLGIGYVNKVVNRLNIEDLTWKSGYITDTGNINSLARGRVEIEKFEVKKGESIEIESTSAYSVGIVYYNQDNTKTRYGYEKSITFPKDGTIQLGVKTDNDSAMSDEQFVQALSLMTLNRTYGLPDSYLSILNAQNLSNKQKDIAKRNLGIGTCYVSFDGNDSNSGTQEEPFATFQHAIDLGYKDIVGFPGVYKNQAISVTNKNGLKISCLHDNNVTDQPYFDSHTRIGRITFDNSTNAENVTLDGTTNLYKFAITRGEDSNWYKVFIGQTMSPERVISLNQTSYNAILWEINRNDITACKKLVPVLSIAACQSQTGSFYYDGTHCYVNPNASDLTDIVFKYLDNEADYNIIALTGCKDIVLENINGYFGTDRIVEITGCVGDNIIDNCDFGFSAYHGGCGVNRSNFKIYDSNVFLTVTDGFNINYYGNVDLYNCSGRYCGDDGVSHHDGCTGVIDGGIWEGNYKAGVAPSYGSRVNVYNVYCTNNAYGLYLVGDSTRKTNYKVLVNNCVFINNSNKDILTMQYSGFISNTTYQTINMSTGSNITLVGNNIVE